MKIKHWVIFIAVGLIWSSSFLWIKIALREIDPTALVAFRMFFGVLTATAIVVYQKGEWPRDWKTWGIFAILGPTSLAIPVFLVSWGEKSIDSAVASVLHATAPLFTLMIAHYWLHDEKMTLQRVFGLLLGFAGIVVLLSKDLLASEHNSVIGQAAVILASLFYAGSAVFARKHTQHVTGSAIAAPIVITATLFMWLIIPFTETSITIPVLPGTWISILWLGILASGLALVMNYQLLHEIGPTRIMMITYVFPPGGIILGVIFLKERISWQLFAGAALIVASLIVVNRQPKTP